MLRVLIIECLLFALFGAIAFRLLYAFIARTWAVWGISLLLIALISALTSGVVDPHLVQEFGGDTLTGFSRACCWPRAPWRGSLAACWLGWRCADALHWVWNNLKTCRRATIRACSRNRCSRCILERV
jgi:hypothetical protein